ncbi:hypothetical protein [Micromonospora haikouensis]
MKLGTFFARGAPLVACAAVRLSAVRAGPGAPLTAFRAGLVG